MVVRWVGILFLGIGLCLGACDADDEDDGGSGSGWVKQYCYFENDTGRVCYERTVHVPASNEWCTSQGGTVPDECPTAGHIGSCSTWEGLEIVHYYEPDDPVSLEASCASLYGTWTPG